MRLGGISLTLLAVALLASSSWPQPSSAAAAADPQDPSLFDDYNYYLKLFNILQDPSAQFDLDSSVPPPLSLPIPPRPSTTQLPLHAPIEPPHPAQEAAPGPPHVPPKPAPPIPAPAPEPTRSPPPPPPPPPPVKESHPRQPHKESPPKPQRRPIPPPARPHPWYCSWRPPTPPWVPHYWAQMRDDYFKCWEPLCYIPHCEMEIFSAYMTANFDGIKRECCAAIAKITPACESLMFIHFFPSYSFSHMLLSHCSNK